MIIFNILMHSLPGLIETLGHEHLDNGEVLHVQEILFLIVSITSSFEFLHRTC